MSSETGLPDYVGDHFDYVIRASRAPRLGQALFFASSLLLPVILAIILLTWSGYLSGANRVALFAVTAVMGASMLWYLVWMQGRLDKFRKERPASYERWYGLRRQRSFGGFDPAGQLQLTKLQLRYVFFGKEPSADETLKLTMQFSRRR